MANHETSYERCLVFTEENILYRVPESWFDSGFRLEVIKEKLERSNMKEMVFRIGKNKLHIYGKYSFLPFRIDFTIQKKDDKVYIVSINEFVFFGMVKYSRKILVRKISEILGKSPEISRFVDVVQENDRIVVKTRMSLSEIFPDKFREK